jgi:pyruvate dehydrogenase E2 component (dihydrolipoamide acetyltransferase)
MADDAATRGAYEQRPLPAVRRMLAARLTQIKQTVPHFYLQTDCDVDGMLGALTRINAQHPGVKLTITDFIIRASALALREVPLANSTWADNAVRVHENADVSVAVHTPFGLITPIIRDANHKSLFDISRELKEIAGRARAGRLKPDEYTGGTFTISNLGMFGIDSNFAIINAPQSCILGVGGAEQRPVVRDGALGIATRMTCTLSVDHRTIDGAVAAELLGRIRTFLQEPESLM